MTGALETSCSAGLVAEVEVSRDPDPLNVRLATSSRRLAIVGPNGAGKSTLVNAIAGIQPVEAGRVALGGIVVDDPATNAFIPPHLRAAALVRQDSLLFPHLDVQANVEFGVLARGASSRDARARAMKWLDAFEMTDFAHAKPRDLSGGQSQRISIARALAIDPDFLLLDEPFANLDASWHGLIRAELATHLTDTAATIVVVTHDPVDVFALADEVIVLDKGQLAQQGSPTSVQRCPRTDYLAQLMGVNLVRGFATRDQLTVGEPPHELTVAVGGDVVGPVLASFRPSDVQLRRIDAAEVSRGTDRVDWVKGADTTHGLGVGRLTWAASIGSVRPGRNGITVELAGGLDCTVELTPQQGAELQLESGMRVEASLLPDSINIYSA